MSDLTPNTPPHDDIHTDMSAESWRGAAASVCSSLKQTLSVPIHREGWPFIIGGLIVALLLGFAWEGFAVIGLLFSLSCVFFFRDPVRTVPQRDGLLVAPADGRIIAIEEDVSWPDELTDAPRDGVRPTRISIFLSVLDVHVIRSPIAATVRQIVHRPGAFVNASLDKASEDNERVSVLLTLPTGEQIGCVLIAGLIARRIVPNIVAGQQVATGERIGVIRFGSRVDLYVPSNLVPFVGVGQRTVGAETQMGDLKLKDKVKALLFSAI